MEYNQLFFERSDEMLEKVYNALSTKDKKIIDKYNEDQINESMAKVYRELSSDDYGQGVYISEGTYLQSNGTFSDE
jgi:hypothetical protein